MVRYFVNVKGVIKMDRITIIELLKKRKADYRAFFKGVSSIPKQMLILNNQLAIMEALKYLLENK